MKIRNVISVVAMLSILLFGIGTAHAVWGINDDVPQQDLVLPLICEKGSGLDTLFAIADKDNAACHYLATSPENGKFYVTCVDAYLWDYKSKFIIDFAYCWTLHDVVNDACRRIFEDVATDPTQAEMVLNNGKTYYVGYLELIQRNGGDIPFFPGAACDTAPTNRFVGWQYLVDLTKGMASGFNAPGAENGLGELLGEQFDNSPIAVASFYPRFYFLNNKTETWNWWIYLFGQNELAEENWVLFANIHRRLDGIICDEQENCYSLSIPIPWEVNVINVYPRLSADMRNKNAFPGNPAGLGGFAMLDIIESGTITFPSLSVTAFGTFNLRFILGIEPPFPYYSAHAWSYQRAQSNDGLPNLSWDVIHPQHRTWCTTSDPVNGTYCGPNL